MRDLEPCIIDLVYLPMGQSSFDPIAVGAVLTKHEITVNEFLEMDERPGQFDFGDWHWKLRRFRYSSAVRSYRFTKETS